MAMGLIEQLERGLGDEYSFPFDGVVQYNRERDIALEMMENLGPDILELAGARYGTADQGPHGMIKTTELRGHIPEHRMSPDAVAHYRGAEGDIEFRSSSGPSSPYFKQVGQHELMHSLLAQLRKSGALKEIDAPGMEDVYKTMVDRGLWSGIKPFSTDPSTGLPLNYISYDNLQKLEHLHKEKEKIAKLLEDVPQWNASDREALELYIFNIDANIAQLTPRSMADSRDPNISGKPEEWAWKTSAVDRWTAQDLYDIQQMDERVKSEPRELPELRNWPMGDAHFFTLARELETEGVYTDLAKRNILAALQAPKGSFIRALAETGVTSETLRAMRAYLLDNPWDEDGVRDFQDSLNWYADTFGEQHGE